MIISGTFSWIWFWYFHWILLFKGNHTPTIITSIYHSFIQNIYRGYVCYLLTENLISWNRIIIMVSTLSGQQFCFALDGWGNFTGSCQPLWMTIVDSQGKPEKEIFNLTTCRAFNTTNWIKTVSLTTLRFTVDLQSRHSQFLTCI